MKTALFALMTAALVSAPAMADLKLATEKIVSVLFDCTMRVDLDKQPLGAAGNMDVLLHP